MYHLYPCATVGNPLVSETDGVVFVWGLLLLFFGSLFVCWLAGGFTVLHPPPKQGFQILHNCLMAQAVCKLRDQVAMSLDSQGWSGTAASWP